MAMLAFWLPVAGDGGNAFAIADDSIKPFRAALAVAKGQMCTLEATIKESKSNNADLIECVQMVVTDATTELKVAIDADCLKLRQSMEESREALIKCVQRISPIAGGAEENALWYAAARAAPTFEAFQEGSAAFVAKDLSEIKKGADELFYLIEADKTALSNAGVVCAVAEHDQGRQAAVRSLLTVAEQKLMMLFADAAEKNKRAKLQPVIRELRQIGVCKEFPAPLKEKEVLQQLVYAKCMGTLRG